MSMVNFTGCNKRLVWFVVATLLVACSSTPKVPLAAHSPVKTIALLPIVDQTQFTLYKSANALILFGVIGHAFWRKTKNQNREVLPARCKRTSLRWDQI